MKILVTGGLGFVGSNLVDKLVDEHEVHVLDDLSSESASLKYKNNKANLIIGKVEDINKIFIGHKFDKIFHLAAKARIQPSFENPIEYFNSNALGTSEVMEFARISKSGIVVYATTSSKNHGSIYITPYTYSKVIGEGILKMYSHCFGINCAMATFYNVYGNREPSEGEWATVVAKFKRQWENKEPITVVGDGQQSRDFTHVDDICEGLIKISEGNWKADNFDLGRGEPIKILDLALNICNGEENNIKFVSLRKNEGQHTKADIAFTFKRINWKAQKDLIYYINKNK
jgi:UDP-glucose 4-epimerase